MLKIPDHKLRVLKDILANIEPFKTPLECALVQGHVSSKQVARALRDEGIKWDFRPEANQTIIDELMVYWSIGSGLLGYEKSNFVKPIS